MLVCNSCRDGVGSIHVSTHIYMQGGQRSTLFCYPGTIRLIFSSDEASLLEPRTCWLGWLATESQGSSSLPPWHGGWDCKHVPSYPDFYLGAGGNLYGLHGKYFSSWTRPGHTFSYKTYFWNLCSPNTTLRGATALKKSDSLLHYLTMPILPKLGIGPPEPLTCPCWNFNWLIGDHSFYEFVHPNAM